MCICISSSSSSSSICTTTLSWVSACSTIVEHSQQEGFTECRCQRHVKPPTWRRTRGLERSNFRHKTPPASEATPANPAAEGGTMGEKWPRILPKLATFTSLLGSFTCHKARNGTWRASRNTTQHTHGARTDLLGSSEDTPKPNFTSQPGRNFGPSKLLRRSNRSEPRRTVSGPR
jgi:hypothetical protein